MILLGIALIYMSWSFDSLGVVHGQRSVRKEDVQFLGQI